MPHAVNPTASFHLWFEVEACVRQQRCVVSLRVCTTLLLTLLIQNESEHDNPLAAAMNAVRHLGR